MMAATTATTSEQPKAFNYVDDDTLNKLRSVGTRVRKSVTEGFQRTVSVPADPISATKRLPFTQTPSFISSNDAMRELLAARAAKNKGTSSAPSSPQQRPKRTLGGEDDEEDADLEEDEMNLDEDEPATAISIRAAREAAARLKEEKNKREIRPLKRSASRPGGVATQSLPASMFRFSHEPANNGLPAVAQIVEEEDWSGNFGSSCGTTNSAGLSADLDLDI
ncbi:hypothetical protein BN946_scf184908.g68 [Trametes cinnabarina]|uniref:Uncharacterized protein n=1 Tax=Pycnoporus cinnabarinus TaxID=5643 RepID=A0A060SAU2_PYCCI|nr:hypothetical protein BN946_scf184908.g68 [Trametes cinnabarina]